MKTSTFNTHRQLCSKLEDYNDKLTLLSPSTPAEVRSIIETGRRKCIREIELAERKM